MGEIAYPNQNVVAKGVVGRVNRSRGLETRLIALAAAAALAGWGIASVSRSPAPTAEAERLPAEDSSTPPDEWIPVARPVALYGIDSPELSTGSRTYTARRRAQSGEREDVLTFGAFAADELHLSLRFHRRGAEPRRPASLFVQTARHAGADGLVVARMERTRDMVSKFGPVETAEATIIADGRERPCVALRFGIANGALETTGFACGTEALRIDRARLACIVDRIALLAPGEDRAIRQAFAETDRRPRGDCGPRRAR